MNAVPLRSPVSRAHVIVIGNEKGAAGKSTLAMHVSVALLRAGKSVGVIDLDLRQRTLSRYLENRRVSGLPMPLTASTGDGDAFHANLADLAQGCAFVVIDTPGADAPLSRAAHACADTLLTPLNDSAVDFDMLGAAKPGAALAPSAYSEMVWESRKQKAQARGAPIDWVVMRNRLSANNKHSVGAALTALSARIGFRMAPGFSERAIFRELFPQGLTLLDMLGERALKMAHLAARQELREMLASLKLPGLAGAPAV